MRAFEAHCRTIEARKDVSPQYWRARDDQIDERYDRYLDAFLAAIRRLLRTPAPDLAGLAVKIELTVDHEIATLDGGESCLAVLKQDARRLAGGG